jgi:hypothetical protein
MKKMFGDCSALKVDSARSSETSVNFYQTTWYHIPEDNAFQMDNFNIGRYFI